MRQLTSKEQGELDFWIDHIIGLGCLRESGKGYLEQWSEGAHSRFQHYFSVIGEPIGTENALWVDVGCGPYSVLLQAPDSVTKVMIDPLMKHYFHHKLVPPGMYGARHVFLEGFAEDLALANESVDVVLCTNALDHVDNPWVALSELVRILKVGGCLILEVDTGGETDELHPHAFSIEELEDRVARFSICMGKVRNSKNVDREHNSIMVSTKRLRKLQNIFRLLNCPNAVR
jgi:ubiquinone/menaquinone biosynthesis C-methylase UbiE